MKRWLLLVLCSWFLTDQGVAQDKQAASGSARASSQALEADGDAPDAWKGPKVQLGYRIYSLHDWQGGGIVNTATFSGFLPTRYLRAGGGVEAGGRRYEYGEAEGLLSGHLFAGYQHLADLGRLVPYLVAMGEYGFTFGKRFHTPTSRAFRGIGAELGTSVRLVRGLHVGIGVSFMVYTMDDLRYDTFGMRLSIGL
jgi:hypothetical protein